MHDVMLDRYLLLCVVRQANSMSWLKKILKSSTCPLSCGCRSTTDAVFSPSVELVWLGWIQSVLAASLPTHGNLLV